jgi:hypothetical protein
MSKDNFDTNKQERKCEDLFQDIGQIVYGDDAKPTEIESYCVNCGENVFLNLILFILFYFKFYFLVIELNLHSYRELQNYY